MDPGKKESQIANLTEERELIEKRIRTGLAVLPERRRANFARVVRSC